MTTTKKPFDLYEVITERIISQIEAEGKLTWVKPWNSRHGNVPMNGKTKRAYDGVNFFLLGLSGYASNYWLSYKQVEEMGGNIRKGEKATQVVFWKMNEYKDKDKATGEETVKRIPLLKYYNVFNTEQCENINIAGDVSIVYNEHEKLEACEVLIAGYRANNPGLSVEVKESTGAYYVPSRDHINMPLLAQFCGQAEYYSTFFHEMGHSTGHSGRLNRKEVVSTAHFGSCDYGQEELTAELCAAFLCAEVGVSNESQERNSAAYLKNWMKAIKADKKMFVMAAQRASKAAKCIIGKVEAASEEIAA